MEHLFEVGEVAIVTHWPNGEFAVGDEVTILQIQAAPTFADSPYVVRIEEGAWRSVHVCGDHNLRKRRAPGIARQELVAWEDCPWRPAKAFA